MVFHGLRERIFRALAQRVKWNIPDPRAVDGPLQGWPSRSSSMNEFQEIDEEFRLRGTCISLYVRRLGITYLNPIHSAHATQPCLGEGRLGSRSSSDMLHD